jgi:pyruvate kinase
MNCHFIFIRTENIKFIHRISTLRPKAFIIIFSDNNSLKGAVATDFGVYVHSLNDA